MLRLGMLRCLIGRKFIIVLAATAVFASLSWGRADAQATLSALPTETVASSTGGCPAHSFFGLMPWYQYLSKEMNGCEMKCFNVFPIPASEDPNSCGQRSSDIPLVLLAVTDDLLRVAGLVAIGFLIYAAFNFITSQGNSEDAASARGMAINALIGLVIALFAIVLVSFVGRTLAG